ncbi:MAG: 23S rRNA (guanosine(2251)-2'-O)-methyltransferase RlmB [Clostridiales bacterium]|nr:23S rRNA (guanosine(2251)-2'-O)-methyltransferase RlmB [Clostridiales bacterium]
MSKERPSRRNTDVVPANDRLEGRNSVLEALKAGREINKLWVLESKDGKKPDPVLSRILNEADKRKIPVVRSRRDALDRISQTHNHQGVIAAVASHEYVAVEDIIEKVRSEDRDPVLVVLDELKDAYNLGSILRIADAAGVDGVIIPKHRSIGLDSVVAKASAGAIEYVPVARVTNVAATLRDLKEKHGFWVFGTAAEGQTPYDKADYKGSIAIVIGSEGEGMRDIVRKECDYLLSIPMAGNVNSLNAAVAAGIVIFEAVKGRMN